MLAFSFARSSHHVISKMQVQWSYSAILRSFLLSLPWAKFQSPQHEMKPFRMYRAFWVFFITYPCISPTPQCPMHTAINMLNTLCPWSWVPVVSFTWNAFSSSLSSSSILCIYPSSKQLRYSQSRTATLTPQVSFLIPSDLFVCQFIERQNVGGRGIFYPLVNSPNGCNRPGWARVNLAAKKSVYPT